MASYNKVILMGNLTRDPELRTVGSKQTAVCDLGLAVNERRKSGNEYVEEATFVDVTLWGRTAEIAEHLLRLNAEGITLCLIEHDMALIRQLCAHVVVMAQGRTLVTGSFDEVVANTEVQEAYLGRRH